jgi:hypothetical protein
MSMRDEFIAEIKESIEYHLSRLESLRERAKKIKDERATENKIIAGLYAELEELMEGEEF